MGGYAQYLDERDHGASYSNYDYELVTLLGAPGILLDRATRPYDYQLQEQWIVGKWRVAVFNGFLPLGIAGLVIGGILIGSLRKQIEERKIIS